jgi:hypothetical protein
MMDGERRRERIRNQREADSRVRPRTGLEFEKREEIGVRFLRTWCTEKLKVPRT